jgi:outer membrane protein OmpA-like peptidoglycan-associated protein
MIPRTALLAGALIHLALASAALAAADCPPLGRMPNYNAPTDAEMRAYDGFAFSVRKGDGTDEVEVRGRACRQSYAVKDGAQTASDLEIQSNYREQIRKAGGQVLYSDERTTTGKIAKGAEETWVRVYSQESEIEVMVIAKTPFKATLAKPAGDDHRLLGRMPSYSPQSPVEKKNFDEVQFTVVSGEESRDVAVQGAKHAVMYHLKPGAPQASPLEVQENYRAAIAGLGGQVLYADPHLLVGRLEQNGQAIWVRVYAQDDWIDLKVVEEKPFQATIQSPQAAALKSALDRQGRVALYVSFDPAKAVLKPDSTKTIAEVVKLLKENPGLKLAIEGHTDDIGAKPANEKLSRDRAAAVLEALAAAGIARDRLKSSGSGADKPAADNATSEGRAKNRRVELVKG